MATTSTTGSATHVAPLSHPHGTHERFGTPPGQRIMTVIGVVYGGGVFLGVSEGARKAGLRFRAENAHRLPTNQRGWYLYHQAKNTQVLKESFKEGHRFGMRLLPWAIIFSGVEEAIDTLRLKEYGDDSRKDFLSTTVAGLTAAGGFSTWKRLPMAYAARAAKFGLLAGLGFGLVQDAIHIYNGQRLAYIDLIGKLFGKRAVSTEVEP